MKAALIFLIFGALLSINYAAQLVGPTPCEVPNVETDAFNPGDSWTNAGKNYSTWDHRFNWFTTGTSYTVFDILVEASPYDPATELVQLWELEPVSGHSGYYRFPAWRRQWGIQGGQSHSFGYITRSSPTPLMLTFNIVKYTCTPNYQITF